MLSQVRKSVCVALIVSTGCLPLATLHAQTMGATNSAIAYNDQGNVTSDSQSSQYRYNRLNQLIYDQATNSKKTINYQYYATGMQATESVAPGSNNTPSTTLYHYYAGQGQLLNSMQDNNFSGYLLANSMALRSYQSASSPQAQIYVRNSHSSVITTISSKATKTQQYNAYGATILSGESSLAKALKAYGINTSPLGYSNYSFDTAADIYYLKARYYTPVYRTFLSRDSYNLNNRYFYVNGNPVMLVDPTGHDAENNNWFSNAWHIATLSTAVGGPLLALSMIGINEWRLRGRNSIGIESPKDPVNVEQVDNFPNRKEIGGGSYGDAYSYTSNSGEKRVVKFPRDPQNIPAENLPERNARIWNENMTVLGRADLATAKVIKYQGNHLLDTPYVANDKSIPELTYRYNRAIRETLVKIQRETGRVMLDAHINNFKFVNGQALPIDSDMFVLPRKRALSFGSSQVAKNNSAIDRVMWNTPIQKEDPDLYNLVQNGTLDFYRSYKGVSFENLIATGIVRYLK